MRQKFLLNIAFLIGLNLLIKPFWVFVDLKIQNATGSAEYGLFFTLFNFSFLFQFLLDLGITNYNNQRVSQDEDFIHLNFTKLATLKFLLAIVYAAITLIAAFVMGYSEFSIFLISILSLNQFLLSFILFLRSNISGLQIFWLDSLLSILDRSILIVLCALLLWTSWSPGPFQIEWLVFAQTAAYATTLVVCLISVFAFSKWELKIPSKAFFMDTAKKSLPFAMIIFFMNLYFRIDAVMIERMLPNGQYEAGVYAQSFRFLDMLNNYIYLFIGILFPLLSKEIARATNINKLVQFSLELLLLPSLFLVGCGIFISEEIIALSYSEFDIQSPQVLFLLLLAYIPVAMGQVYGTVLTAGGKLKLMLIFSGASFVLNIIMNFILIPQWGIIGAASASLGTNCLMAIGCYIGSNATFKVKLPVKMLLSYGMFTLVSLLVLNKLLPELTFEYTISILLGLTACYGIYFGISRSRELKRFGKQ